MRRFCAPWLASPLAIAIFSGCAESASNGARSHGDGSLDGGPSPYTGLHDSGLIGVDGLATDDGPRYGAVNVQSCDDAAKNPGNAGCTFYPVQVPELLSLGNKGSCFAMTVVNPGNEPAKLSLERKGFPISLSQVTRIPHGTGNSMQYTPFDESVGLPGGEVAIIFLAGENLADSPMGHVNCPAGVDLPPRDPSFYLYSGADTPPDDDGGMVQGVDYWSQRGTAFRLASDRPVIAYQTYPYGGGASYVTSAALLLPVEAWGTSHFVALPFDDTAMPSRFATITAAYDRTEVAFRVTDEIRPTTARDGSPWPGSPSAPSGSVFKTTLDAGEFVELATGALDLNTAPNFSTAANALTSTKPVSVVSGSPCQFKVEGTCDSTHQQIPPLSAMGHQYAAVGYRNRCPQLEESIPWLIMGMVEGTELTYAPAPSEINPVTGQPVAPKSINAGQMIEFSSRDPFVVTSQDENHPFYLAGYMTGARITENDCIIPTDPGEPPRTSRPGDPDFVNVVPVEQFMTSYIFFTDPTYPTTNLVLVRAKDESGSFADVKLDCAKEPLSGWKPLGDLQYTRVDLTNGDFMPAIPGCDNGRNRIESQAPFSVTVWGWGQDDVELHGESTADTSYGYPGGSAIRKVNNVALPTIN
jgi:IgGFc binding protein